MPCPSIYLKRMEQTRMLKKDVFTTILAMAGTALVWLPVLAPVLFSVASVSQERAFRFDYLMPAELFPVVLVGGCLLIWSTLRARLRRRLIGWGFAIAVACWLVVRCLLLSLGCPPERLSRLVGGGTSCSRRSWPIRSQLPQSGSVD